MCFFINTLNNKITHMTKNYYSLEGVIYLNNIRDWDIDGCNCNMVMNIAQVLPLTLFVACIHKWRKC